MRAMTAKKTQMMAIVVALASFWHHEWAMAQEGNYAAQTKLDDNVANPLKEPSTLPSNDWSKVVRGFRREHNFALTLGADKGSWFLSHQLTQNDQQPVSSTGYYGYFSYTFHLPIYRGMGYFLGSGIGAIIKDQFEKNSISAAYCYSLPGLILGLTANLSSALRVNGALSGYLERIDGFSYKQLPSAFGDRNSMSITTRVWATNLSLDTFFKLPWAVRFEGEFRRLSYHPPNGVTDEVILAYPLQKDEWRLGVGMVYHLL